MGRELKRVPLEFNWPIDKVWKGYINPYYVECSACGGSGSSMAAKRLESIVRLILLSGSDAAEGRCHPYFYEMPMYESRGKICGKDMVELSTGLAERSPSSLGHDACDAWNAQKKIIKAAGLPDTWGICQECDGHGIPRDKYDAYDNWKSEEPPIGEGYQIWETVSEGSPISPVFDTPEKLAEYMAENHSQTANYDTWLNFINGPGWAPSFVVDSKGVHSGVEGFSRESETKP